MQLEDKKTGSFYGFFLNCENSTLEIRQLFLKLLQEEGLFLTNLNDGGEKEGEKMLQYKVSASRAKMEEAAELVGLLKKKKSTQNEQMEELMEPFVRNEEVNKFVNYSENHFFYPCEQMFLVRDILYRIKLNKEFLHALTVSNLANLKEMKSAEGDSLVVCCQQLSILGELIPLHDEEERKKIWSECLYYNLNPFALDTNLKQANLVRQYYGAKVAIYFAWMSHFTMWLIGPAIFGTVIWLHNWLDKDTSIDNSMLAPYFTLFIILWGAIYLQFWHRQSATLACEWGLDNENVNLTGSVCKSSFEERPEFEGELKFNPMTGKKNLRYSPYWKQLVQYCISFVVTCVMLFIAFFVMVLSLNFQGYIHSESMGARFLHFPVIHQFSLPGAFFDQNGAGPYPLILPYVPTIVHSLVIMQLNGLYRSLAAYLTELENHQLKSQFENALVLKRFGFESFDCYIALFYLAFCQMDIVLLRNELISLYTVDSIRRLTTESLIPLLLQYISTTSNKKKDDMKDKKVLLQDILIQDEYEQFDDYIEMVIEFGYVVLFACAFPLGAVLSIVSNLIEMKCDLFKLTYVVRRPEVERQANLGIWSLVLKWMVLLSTITNVFIFGFTTEQMMQVAPSMFENLALHNSYGSDHTHGVVLGQGRYVIGIVFLLEHVLLIVIQMLFTMIPNEPEDITLENNRRQKQNLLQHEREVKVQTELLKTSN